MVILYNLVNPLTMWLTFATFVGYAIIYTVILKPLTPQNIVIGGLSGAMPPALGWATVADSVPAEAWVLVLIIFIWTPPHFWALALSRNNDYAKSGLPMLPVTPGKQFTRLHILMYSFVLFAATLMPFIVRISGMFSLLSVIVLIIFIWTPPHFWALALYRNNDYAKSGLPMLPVTHCNQFTRLHILLYSFVLFAATLLPFIVRMSGMFYLISAIVLSGMFIGYSWRLYKEYSDELSRKLFRFSILYLALLFAALLIDHRSEEHTSELQSLMRISYAVFCFKKKK